MTDEDDEEASEDLDDIFAPTGDGEEDPAFVDDGGSVPDPADASPGVDSDAPLGDLADRARQGQDHVSDDVMDAFSEVEVGDVDADELWSELEDDDIEATVDEPRGNAERDVSVVEKRDYCQRCQYFSDPPEVRCGHDRAEIVEMVDTDQFEVADCPIVRGEEDLENLRR